MTRWRLLATILALACLTACSRDKSRQQPEEEKVKEYWKLPLLSESHHQGLQQELARLVSERATPVLLMADEKKRKLSTSGPIPNDDNIALALRKVCKADMARILNRQAEALYPRRPFEFSFKELSAATEFRLQYINELTKFRQALTRSRCDFGVKTIDGFHAKTSFVYIALLGVRLEGIQAAEHLQADRPEDAVESLQAMFHMAELLAHEKHLVPRLTAVQMHNLAFDLLAAIVNHPHATRDIQLQLAELVNAKMAHWPAEADVWIDQRASGLHIYEHVRDGYLTSFLSEEEINGIETRFFVAETKVKITIDDFANERIRNIDEDEHFYLQTMRRVIDSCRLPYHQRKKEYKKISLHLDTTYAEPKYPFVADAILQVREIQQIHKLMSQERALFEVWTLALASALERQVPPFKTNPTTGRTYKIERQDRHVSVWDGSGGLDQQPLKVQIFDKQN